MPWRELFPTRAALAIALFVCVVAPVTLVALEIDANPKFSPVDEATHFDYVDRVANGEIPRQGQHLQQSTLRELACRKSVLRGLRAPPCSTRHLTYDQFSATYQYEAQQPPTYYALTVPIRWVLEKVAISDRVDATRAANLLWLLVGMLLLWAAGRVMLIDPLPLGAALLLLVTAPIVVYFTATVTNDATAVPAAGLVALVAALAYRRDSSYVPLALFGAGFAAAACKTTNLFAIVSVSALFGVAAATRRAHAERWMATLRRWFHDGGPLLLGGAVASGIWIVVHRSLALIDLSKEPTFDVLRGTPRTFGLLVRESTELFRPLTGLSGFVPLSPGTLGQNAQAPFAAALTFLLIGAGLAGLFVSPRRWPHVLGLIAVPTLYLGGIVFGLGLMINYKIDPGLSGRYGLSIAPLLIVVLAASLVGKWPQRVIAGLAVGSFVTTFLVMVT